MIHSVAVLGAGAVGSYVIWGISSLDDVELGVIAEGLTTKYITHRCGHQKKQRKQTY